MNLTMKKLEGLFKKWRMTIILLAVVILISLGLRLLKVFVGTQPIFADEAIYVRWAQVMKAEPTLRFLPLSDGKQPLYMWILMFLLKPSFDPLITGRMLSVSMGILSNFGVFVLSYILFKSKKISLIASLLYAVSPFMIFFESMALVDATLTAMGIWFFIFLLLAIRYFRFDLSMVSGFFLGGALLTKSPAVYFSILTPITIFIESVGRICKQTPVRCAKYFSRVLYYLFKYCILILPAILIAYGMYNILRLGPNFHLISQRNSDYIFPISQIWTNPKDPFIFHIKEIIDWLWKLGPGVIIFTILLGIIAGLKNYRRQTIILLAWIALPLFANSMYAKVFTARYILFVMPYIYIISSLFILFKTKIQKLSYLMLALFIVSSIMVNYLLIYEIEKAPLPKSERTGYLEEWTAGYGIKEVSECLKIYQKNNPDDKLVIGTEGYFGTLPDGLQIYLNNNPEITVIGVGLSIKELPNQLKESREAGNKTYLVINSSRLDGDPDSMGLKLIDSFPKPIRTIGTHDFYNYGPRETMYFFEVI